MISRIINNVFFKIYVGLIIAFLTTSVCTNMYLQGKSQKIQNSRESPNINFLNECSNNALAVLLLPAYVTYKSCNYAYNNFDLIFIKIQEFFKYIFDDILYKKIILNVIRMFEYVYDNFIVPFVRAFIDIIYEHIVLNMVRLVKYICVNTIQFLETIFNYICNRLVIPFVRLFVDTIQQIILNIIR